MRKIIFPIALILFCAVEAHGASISEQGETAIITFALADSADSVHIFAGQDTSSWEIDGVMSMAFIGDGTFWARTDTFDNAGMYWVKIGYRVNGTVYYTAGNWQVEPEWATLDELTEGVWHDIDTTNVDTSEIGTWLSTGVNASIDYEKVWYDIDTTNVDSSEIGKWLAKAPWNADTLATDDSSKMGNWQTLGGVATIDYEKVWYDIDTTNIDSSVLGKWFTKAPWEADLTAYDADEDSSAGFLQFVAGDSSGMAHIDDVWRNRDTTHVDSSDIGVWLVNNTGGGSSNWSNAQRDSVLGVIADAGKVGIILDTLQLYDDWIAQQTEVANLDGWGPMLGTDSLMLKRISVSSDDGHAVHISTSNSGSHAIFAHSSLLGDGIRAQGTGAGHGLNLLTGSGNALNAVSSSGDDISGDITGNITGNLSGSIGDIPQGVIDSNAFNLNAWYEFLAYDDSTAPDLDNEFSKWLQNNLGAGASSPWSTDQRDSVLSNMEDGAITSTKLADDLTFDSLHTRTFVIKNTGGTGYGLYIGSNQDNDAALMVDGTGTNTDGARFSGTGKDFNFTLNIADVTGQFDSVDFSDELYHGIAVASDSGAAGGAGADSTMVYGAVTQVLVDSTSRYQGSASGLTAQEVIDSMLAQTNADTVDASMLAHIVRNVGSGVWSESEKDSILAALFDKQNALSSGAITFLTRMLIGYPGATPEWDSLSNSITSMIGLYTGVAGSNIEDDFDSLFADMAGDGPRLCSLMVVDATPAAITDGSTRMTSGSNTYTADISGDGFAVFGLTDATWSGLAYATGYTQDTIPQTFVISASTRDTITMTAISIPGASAPNMVNTYIYTYDIIGDTVVGARMEITPNGRPPFRDTDSNIVMIPRLVSAHSNTDGLVQQEIVRSSEATDLNGNNVTYNFKITKGNYFSALFENRTAPDSASWHIK